MPTHIAVSNRSPARLLLRAPSSTTLTYVSLSTGLATAGAFAAPSAPAGVWIAALILAALFLLAAVFQHWREGEADTSDRSLLADALANEIARGNNLFEEFIEANYPSFATADVEAVSGPIQEVLNWASRIEQTLSQEAPERLHEFGGTGFAIQFEMDPEDITVDSTMKMLGTRIRVLSEIVRALRSSS